MAQTYVLDVVFRKDNRPRFALVMVMLSLYVHLTTIKGLPRQTVFERKRSTIEDL